MGSYDIAQICRNGHLINSSSRKYPSSNKSFCDRCGLPTITACDDCGNSIRGKYHSDTVLTVKEISVPSYCEHCGKPYPWVYERLVAAAELADITDELSEEDKYILKRSLDDIVRDSPKTQVSAIKLKRVLANAPKQIASAFRDIIVDVASEAAKKTLWP